VNVKVAEGLSIRQRLRWRHLAWVAAGLLGLHVASMFTTPLETAIWITLGLFGALILAVWLSAMKTYGSSMGGWMGPLGISVICFMGPLPLVFSSFVSEARFRVSQPAFDRLLSRSASRHAAPRQLGLIRVEECSWPDWTEWDMAFDSNLYRVSCGLPAIAGDFETFATIVWFDNKPSPTTLETHFGYDAELRHLQDGWYFIRDSRS
jgi:hypothetical protein